METKDCVITKKYTNIVGPGKTNVHWLDLTFTTANGVSRSDSINVVNTIHDRYQVGSPVQVTYVKSKPEYFYIPGTQPTERDVGMSNVMFTYGAGASVVFLVALLGMLFIGKGGGTPSGQSPEQLLNRATGYRETNRPRTGFGTRNT